VNGAVQSRAVVSGVILAVARGTTVVAAAAGAIAAAQAAAPVNTVATWKDLFIAVPPFFCGSQCALLAWNKRGRNLESRRSGASEARVSYMPHLQTAVIGMLSLRINEPELPWLPFAEQADRFLHLGGRRCIGATVPSGVAANATAVPRLCPAYAPPGGQHELRKARPSFPLPTGKEPAMPTHELPVISLDPGLGEKRKASGNVVIDRIESVVTGDPRRRPLLVYIHIPFCSSKCTFCTWVAGVSVPQLRSSDEIRSRYAEAVKKQIEFYAPRLSSLGYVPEIVYWGGGTPSALSADQISTIANAVRDNFDLSAVREYTVESSPETLTAENIREFQNAGMNRISIGIQSFDESELRRAGRAHSPTDAEDAFHRAGNQGFVNRNIDIVTGFPKQTREVLAETLKKTLELRPEHVTAYSYYKAAGTVMARQIARGTIHATRFEERVSAQELVYEMLTSNGYSEYMPMYYSRSDQFRFNGELYYFGWEGDHFGFGSGAFSVIANHRTLNSRGNIDGYISSPTTFDSFEKYDLNRAVNESLTLMFLNGRTITYDRFFNRFGFDFRELLEVPQMSAFMIALDRIGSPLRIAESEAYVARPAGGWNGAELVRLGVKVRAEIASAAHKASASEQSRRSS
jgi:oxygen-independent coproporphyrinogen-3 oxidase